MKTLHALMLAGAILGAAWILKPAPVEQISQAGLEEREKLDRWWRSEVEKAKIDTCARAIGKTADTLNLDDPKEAVAYRRCMWPEQEYGWLRRTWNRMISSLIW